MNTLDLSEIKAIPGNNRCVDCGLTNPDWASISFGTLFCLECSGIHRSLGVHISFVRSLAMDSWSPQQIAIMKAGGNNKCQAYLASKGIPSNTLIRDKYDSEDAQNYKEVLKARAEGRPEPKIFPKRKNLITDKDNALEKNNHRENVNKSLRGETHINPPVFLSYCKDKAGPKFSGKFIEDKMERKIQGIGSSNPYKNDTSIELNYIKDSLFLSLGSALKSIGNIADKAECIFSNERNFEVFRGKVKTAGLGFWRSVKNLTQKTTMSLVESEDECGLYDLRKKEKLENNLMDLTRTTSESIGYDKLSTVSYVNSDNNISKFNSMTRMARDSNSTDSCIEYTQNDLLKKRNVENNNNFILEHTDVALDDSHSSRSFTFTSNQSQTIKSPSVSKPSQNNMSLNNIFNNDFFSTFDT